MSEVDGQRVGFSGIPSRPQARRLVRLLVFLLMLALAVGAIWFIDRGATMTNVKSGAATRATLKTSG